MMTRACLSLISLICIEDRALSAEWWYLSSSETIANFVDAESIQCQDGVCIANIQELRKSNIKGGVSYRIDKNSYDCNNMTFRVLRGEDYDENDKIIGSSEFKLPATAYVLGSFVEPEMRFVCASAQERLANFTKVGASVKEFAADIFKPGGSQPK